MISSVRILPEVKGEQEVNKENKERNMKTHILAKTRRIGYSAKINVVSRGHILSIKCIQKRN
jgi:hypothetical protein